MKNSAEKTLDRIMAGTCRIMANALEHRDIAMTVVKLVDAKHVSITRLGWQRPVPPELHEAFELGYRAANQYAIDMLRQQQKAAEGDTP
jgi:hypothetical protein